MSAAIGVHTLVAVCPRRPTDERERRRQLVLPTRPCDEFLAELHRRGRRIQAGRGAHAAATQARGSSAAASTTKGRRLSSSATAAVRAALHEVAEATS